MAGATSDWGGYMRKRRSRIGILLVALSVLCLLTMGCFEVVYDDDEAEREAQRLEQEKRREDEAQAALTAPQNAKAPKGSDQAVIFSFSGDNPSYHTSLLSKTEFYLDFDWGTASASSSKNFEEPFGTQVSRGTDSVKFTGKYDHKNKTMWGTLEIRTQGTATGGGSDSTSMTYVMTGQMKAAYDPDDQWVGTVTGTSVLTQTWADGHAADSKAENAVDWTAKGYTSANLTQ